MQLFLGILIGVVVGGLTIYLFLNNTRQKQQQEWKKRNDVLIKRNVEIEKERQYLKAQLNIALNNNTNAANELETALAAAKSRLEELEAQITSRTADLNEVAAHLKKLHDESNEVNAKNAAAAVELNGYKVELESIVKELDDAKETKRGLVLSNIKNNNNWFDFELSSKESKLITTIAEISALYPELSKELATIEWKKIWLPKFQDLSNSNGLGVRGIYRLVLKKDENVCYVGQAVNIKERWYDHVKKMVGADNKGNEKLYKYRPEDFYWTVIEMGSQNLNAAEHYWIEYYCCKEVGLNKKV